MQAKVNITLHGSVPPAPRPRVTKFGTYYTPKYKEWQDAAVAEIKELTPVRELAGPLALNVVFFLIKPKTTKLFCPRGDIDNYLKSIMDAITMAKLWEDDSMVVKVKAIKSWSDVPRTRIIIDVLGRLYKPDKDWSTIT